MWRDLNDARIALGWGAIFIGYAFLIVADRWRKNRKIADETRARLILDNAAAPERRARLIAGEGITEGID